jgi:mRNA interferase MazF
MKEGDVVLAAVPQVDAKTKTRPLIVLREMPPYRDLLVCGVSTQIHHRVEGFDEVISPSDNDFATSGLVAESLIRLGFVTVLPRRIIAGSIGSISQERHRRLLGTFSRYLLSD